MSVPPPAASEQQASLTEACDSLARQRRSRSPDADDVAQESCIRALEVSEPQFVRDPVRYLLRIGRNLLVDRARKRVRETALKEALAVVEYEGQGTPDPERILAGKQELKRVLAAMAQLPPRCRQAFMLHRFNGLSYAAIARRMDISTSMVEKHIASAMVKLYRAKHGPDEAGP